MKDKIIKFFGWLLGISAIVGGLYKLSSEPLISIYLFAIAVFILPPINQLILKSKYAKYIKLIVGLAFFLSIIILAYKPAPDEEGDKIKLSNLSILHTISKEYCIDNGECAESLNQLFSSGHTGPFESFNQGDYFYRGIDDGIDCVISITLSTGEQKSRLCIGDNVDYVKYLVNPNYKE